MYRLSRILGMAGLGAVLVLGSTVVASSGAGASGFPAPVDSAGIASLAGGGTVSVHQDYYQATVSSATTTLDFTITIPTVTCTKAEHKKGATDAVTDYLLGTPKSSVSFPGEDVAIFESCGFGSPSAAKPVYTGGLDIDGSVTPSLVTFKPGTTATVVMSASATSQSVTLTDKASSVDQTGTLDVGLKATSLQMGFQVQDSPFPTFTPLTYSGISFDRKSFGSLKPTATQDITGTTLSPVSGGNSFTVTDSAAA